MLKPERQKPHNGFAGCNAFFSATRRSLHPAPGRRRSCGGRRRGHARPQPNLVRRNLLSMRWRVKAATGGQGAASAAGRHTGPGRVRGVRTRPPPAFSVPEPQRCGLLGATGHGHAWAKGAQMSTLRPVIPVMPRRVAMAAPLSFGIHQWRVLSLVWPWPLGGAYSQAAALMPSVVGCPPRVRAPLCSAMAMRVELVVFHKAGLHQPLCGGRGNARVRLRASRWWHGHPLRPRRVECESHNRFNSMRLSARRASAETAAALILPRVQVKLFMHI